MSLDQPESASSGLGTGATVRVVSRDANRDVVEIASDAMDSPVSIGTLSAAKLMVR